MVMYMREGLGKLLMIAAGCFVLPGCTAQVPEGNIMDGDGMEYDFTRYQLVGEWTEYGEEYPWKLTFIEGSMRWITPEGTDGSADFTLDDSASDIHRTLTFLGEDAPFDTLLFRKIAVNGWNTNCLFQLDGDGNTIRLFVKDTDVYLLPKDYTPAPADGEQKTRSGEYRPVYLAVNALDTLKWLGRTPEETRVSPMLMDDEHILFDGRLFGEKVTGTVWCVDVYDGITMYADDLSFEKAVSEFTDLYGEGELFDIPYVQGEGDTVGVTFTQDKYTVTVRKASEQNFLQILVSGNPD